jgi:hypothetical protein
MFVLFDTRAEGCLDIRESWRFGYECLVSSEGMLSDESTQCDYILDLYAMEST